jgi:hypothetical protein
MTADDILLDAEDRMEKALGVLKHGLSGIRTGRANPGLVDSLRVEVYGSPTPIKQLASVGAPEPTQIVIRPYDPGTIKDIEKAIIASDLGTDKTSYVDTNVNPGVTYYYVVRARNSAGTSGDSPTFASPTASSRSRTSSPGRSPSRSARARGMNGSCSRLDLTG